MDKTLKRTSNTQDNNMIIKIVGGIIILIILGVLIYFGIKYMKDNENSDQKSDDTLATNATPTNIPKNNPPATNPIATNPIASYLPKNNPLEDNPPEDNPPEDNPPEDNPPEDIIDSSVPFTRNTSPTTQQQKNNIQTGLSVSGMSAI